MYKSSTPANKGQNNNEINNLVSGNVIGFIIGAVLFAVTITIAHTHQLTGLQARVFYDLNNLSNSYKQPALLITESLGSAIPIVICVIAAALLKRFRLAWRFFFTAGGAFTVAYIIKKIIVEPRPEVILNHHLYVRAIETGPGFPSGHETAATALALTLWAVLPKNWRWLPIVWIIVVGVSRLYLGVHTPADIIGGFAIGLMAYCAINLLPKAIARPLRLDTLDDKA